MSAPCCAGCGHMVVMHGAGRCRTPFANCTCRATPEVVWPEKFGPDGGAESHDSDTPTRSK